METTAMKRLSFILGLAAVLCFTSLGAKDGGGKIVYYVQLVRGTVEAKAPEADAKPIGPKIAKRLSPVFKWNHYWEMARTEIAMVPGEKKRVELSSQRSVEIDLTDPAKLKVTAFDGKKPVYKMVNPVGSPMTIIGGDRSTNSSWFIIVRRDKPAR